MDTQGWRDKANYFDFEGHQIAYWNGGIEDGETLLLVHGYPTCSWDWTQVWEKLGAQYRLIACDMLGFGLSDKPKSGYSIHRQTDLQEALLTHLGVTEYQALVHDYGVSVGQELLARTAEGTAKQKLGRMVFLNGGIFPDQHRPVTMQKIGVSPFGFLLGLLINQDRFAKSFGSVFGPDTKPSSAELEAFWGFISHKGGNRIMHKLLHYIADRRTHKERWEEALRQSESRIGLINGALDPVSGKHAYDKWREVVPNAQHHLLETIGHYPQVEAPEVVADKALEWLSA